MQFQIDRLQLAALAEGLGLQQRRPARARSRPIIAVMSAEGPSDKAMYSPTSSPLRSTVMRSEMA
jgi:hypothetical protein